ncbi:Cell division protein FtsL [Ruminococcaceae bacterium YRB3002]|nr:Cell division protein FtsL [Ruminococcaceae bacterium YRB3002]
MAVRDRRFSDRALDESINARRDVYVLGSDGITKESDRPVIEEEHYVTRETVERNTARYAEKFSQEHRTKEEVIEQNRMARRLTGRRVFEAIIALLLVVFVSALAILMMYPQTQLAEMSRDNSNAKDRITKLRNEILDAEENINGVSDMDNIRRQALQLGMQDPNHNQVVNLPIPSTDTLRTVVSYDSDGISEEALENAVVNLTDYYRAKAASADPATD